jgi:hypothetical protein
MCHPIATARLDVDYVRMTCVYENERRAACRWATSVAPNAGLVIATSEKERAKKSTSPTLMKGIDHALENPR